jgi:hypothetical protein
LQKRREPRLSLASVGAFTFFQLARGLHRSACPTGRGRAPSPPPHRARARLGISDGAFALSWLSAYFFPSERHIA